jgi:hypothetical protein
MRTNTFGATLVAALLAAPGSVQAFEILAPAPGAVVRPGAVVTFRARLGPGEIAEEVSFLTDDGATRAPLVAAGEYEAQVRIPVEAVGPDIVVALAVLSGGGAAIAQAEIVVDPGPLRGLLASVRSLFTFGGEIAPIRVSGVFSDGVERDLMAADRGTTYSSSNPAVAAVDASGLVQARHTGIATITVTNRGRTATVQVEVAIPQGATNQIPVVTVGPDQVVPAESIVTLAVNASDPDPDDNNRLEYIWEQVGGRVVAMRNVQSANPVFVSPRLPVQNVLEFLVSVRDPQGATTLPALVRVVVQAAPQGGLD